MEEESPPAFSLLASLNVAIIGLGLMGGSLAMLIHGRCRSLIGIDNDPVVLEHARKLKIADVLGRVSDDLIPLADVIVLATPVGAILDLIASLPSLHPGSPIVMDLGSTKAEVLERMKSLPERFDPLGAHPMCGKEHNSLLNADPGLYSGAVFVLCPLERTSSKARELAVQMVQAVRGNAVWMDAESHDRKVAATSHLPYLAANMLAAITPLEAALLAGPGFRSTTRVGETNPSLMIDVLKSNRDNVLRMLTDYRNGLEIFEALLVQKDWEKIEQLLSTGCTRRQEILKVSERNSQCS
ncbi:MAG: prephenate dehydrogenase/arogenate dehydrogenase family protein [Anaerolineae bacterium]|nr:prephenate dehydrogenase/arogenate dehydrogenase family protein [Anaerolineae bacterium]